MRVRIKNLARVGGQIAMDRRPENGEKILIFKKGPPRQILNEKKKLEARGTNYKAGIYWLGCKSVIHGIARLGPGTLIDNDKDWARLRNEHLVQSTSPPYAKTYLFEIIACERRNLPFRHLKGAVSIVKYRGK